MKYAIVGHETKIKINKLIDSKAVICYIVGMKENIIARGGMPSNRACPSPKAQERRFGKGKHAFRDISSKPGSAPGERLVTSKCDYCGGLVIDCPTIGAVI